MKAALKGKYDIDKNGGAAATVAFNAGDVKLRASITDATFTNGPSLAGLVLAVEKPGSFIVDYNVPKKDFRFQFMNTVRVAEKPLNFAYIHSKGDNRTILDGTLVWDPSNKVSANYAFDSGNCKLKYSYVHKSLTTFEPSYDVAKNSWDFAVSRRVYGDDSFKASYQTSSKVLGFEWARNSKNTGCFKILASLNLAEERKLPKLSAETTWNFEMKDGVWVSHLLSGYSLPMEDPNQGKGETNVEIGGTWRESIKAAYEATGPAFPGGEILAHLDQK